MASIDFLEKGEEKITKCIESELGKSTKDMEEYVKIIKDWLQSQRHLPETPSDLMIQNFLLMNKFSIEKTKPKLDMYYTIRPLVPEFFQNKNPFSPHMEETANMIYYIPLPKLAPSNRRVMFCGFKANCHPDKFNMENFIAHLFNCMEVLMQDGLAVGYILITDCKNMRSGHVQKFSPMILKKSSTVGEKVFSNRIVGLHLVNVHPYLDTLISLGKTIIPKKMAERFFVHRTLDTLYEEIPRSVLPSDLGGEEKSLEELDELWMRKFGEYKSRFDVLEQLKVKEELRPTPLVNDDILGFHGNFRKLDVD